MLAWFSHSEEQTYKIGKWIGENAKPGDIILLYGDLGSGKTVLSKGIAHGAGVSGVVTSPTFTLMNVYMGRLPVYHFDIYRINDPEELFDLDYEDYFYGNGVSIVEWPDKLGFLLPKEFLKITITRLQEENVRKIAVEFIGEKYAALKEVLCNNEHIGS